MEPILEPRIIEGFVDLDEDGIYCLRLEDNDLSTYTYGEELFEALSYVRGSCERTYPNRTIHAVEYTGGKFRVHILDTPPPRVWQHVQLQGVK